MTPFLPDFLAEPETRRLLAAFADAGIEARFVGGCVRDALLGLAVGDLDIATPVRPEAVIAALQAAGLKAVPTGLAHGTVTAIVGPRSFEITTLRRDVETDGRHARVAFDAAWDEDAARRDFTINAIYLAPDGTLYDPVGGRADLFARRVRFVGDPATRIAEDVLRILRYYRFEARFGSGDGDAASRAACRGAVGELAHLSAERVSHELLRLLALPDPLRALAMMRDDGVLAEILPEATRFDRLARLIAIEPAPEPMLRLAALVAVGEAGAYGLAERLRLSNPQRKWLAQAERGLPFGPDEMIETQRAKLFLFGGEHPRYLVLLRAADGKIDVPRARRILAVPDGWQPPVFPLGGDDVTALGIPPGPQVGGLLRQVRAWWEAGDFAADRRRCLARLKELAASASASR